MLPYPPQLAGLAQDCNQPVVNVTFDHLTVPELMKRNSERAHPVPDDVLMRFVGHWANTKLSNYVGYTISANELRSTLKASKASE